MGGTIESGLFLILFIGLGTVIPGLFIAMLVRESRAPSSIGRLEHDAVARGWRSTREPRRDRLRFEGLVEGIPFTLMQARRHRRGRGNLRFPVMVELPIVAAPGLLLLQRRPPASISGGPGRGRSWFVGWLSMVLDEHRASMLASLEELPTSAPASEYAVWSTDPNHPLASAADEVAQQLGSLSRAHGVLMVDVLDGVLTLRAFRPRVVLASLVDLAFECRRLLLKGRR